MVGQVNFQLWERIHGHIATLAVVLLVHPAWLLWRGQTLRARRVGVPALILLILGTALGFWIYPDYREEVKPLLRLRAPDRVPLFEVKEHLAWLCLLLTVGGVGMLRSGAAAALPGARVMLASAAVLGLIVVALGVWVAAG